ncbi:MAG: tRNA pseudouridine(38-40) synthase TruA [Verrucomicrobiales bacterium]|nr:tRNA pseudouridine(38-40) synthase TruA [Verrucomicrobiales bacterium]
MKASPPRQSADVATETTPDLDVRPREAGALVPGHRRLRLTLSYCGTPWRGWQSQADESGIQDQLHAAIHRLTRLRLIVHGGSRTDAGVHALCQTAHFDVPTSHPLPPSAWQGGLNQILPGTIRILEVTPAEPDFHASLSACGKIYQYRIQRAASLSAFDADRVWHLPGPLDLDALAAALPLLRGTHNFVRLSANPGRITEIERRRDTSGHTRTLRWLEWSENGNLLTLRVEGDAFLYHMMRLIVGALMQIGRRRASLDWLADLLRDPHGPQCQNMAPAAGLYLERGLY